MSRIRWGSLGTHKYEAGVDRGVFYPNVGPGLPWNGLINVEEKATDEVSTKFVDGVPYRTQKTTASFAAVLQAFTAPLEFEEYDGSNGQRRRKAFGLSYRTGIGNELTTDNGYLIHLVYNALAEPAPLDSTTTDSEGLNATPFSWGLSTTPTPIPGAKPAAHFVIDAMQAYPEALRAVEDVIYGNDDNDPRLPTVIELLDLVEQFAILLIIDHGDGTWTATGPDDVVYMLDDETFEISWPSAIYLNSTTYKISSL